MSVLIKDMEMPRSCYDCKLDLRTDVCSAFREWEKEHPYTIKCNDRLPNCPLVEVSEPHGDPIDRQAAIEAMGKAKWAKERLMDLPSAQPLVIHCTDCEDWHERQSILGFAISELPSAQPDKCDRCRFTFFEKGGG